MEMMETEVPAHDRVVDERGSRCPKPIISLARMAAADPAARILLLADDAAADTDVPAWCGFRSRTLSWVGPAPDGHGRAYLVVPVDPEPAQS